MKKVIILGSGGSGKSTLARRLSDITGLRAYHIDSIFWKPGWVSISDDELINSLNEVISKDSWIIDGNYSRTIDMRLDACDTVIFLDYPRWMNLYRVLKRRIMYHNKPRPDMASGCREKLDLEFLMWVYNYPKRTRKKMLDKLESSDKDVYVFRKRRQLEKFLGDLTNSSGVTKQR